MNRVLARRALTAMLVLACVVAPGTRTAVCEEGEAKADLDWADAPLTRVHDLWHHASPTSAVLYGRSDGACRSFVEYGPTARYGSRTPMSSKASFGHLHRLRGLEAETTYHCRLVCVDSSGKTVAGADTTITPVPVADAISVPGDLKGPPYVLDQPDATYVLTEDIQAPRTALEVRTPGVTLDLDGHTVIYNTTFEETDFLRRKVSSARGVLLRDAPGARVLNGIVRQGSATATASAVEIEKSDDPELAGLTVQTVGDATGIESVWGFEAGRIHHNLCVDGAAGFVGYGGHWTPRACIAVSGPGVHVHHNVVRGTFRLLRVGRAGGMNDATGAAVFENDLHLDARHFTAVAVALFVPGGVVRDNRILAEGCPSTGILLPDGDARYAQVRGNRIRIHPTRPHEPYANDAAPWDLAVGIVAGGGVYGLDVRDNTVLVYGGTYGAAGPGAFVGNGLRFVNMMFDNTRTEVLDNRITAIGEEGQQAACVVVTGGSQAPTLVFRNNRLESNHCHVVLTDREHSIKGKGELDGGRNARFIGNTHVRLGTDEGFRTVRCGRDRVDSHAYFLDTAFEGGAGWRDVHFGGEGGLREVRIGRPARLEVRDEDGRAIGDAAVELRFADPARRYGLGRTGCDGVIELPVVDTVLTPAGPVSPRDTTFVVRKDGFQPLELSSGSLPCEVTLARGGEPPSRTIDRLRAEFADREPPEAEWDWIRAPLTATRAVERHVSVTSACVYWQTDGRAWGFVEYGPTAAYGQSTSPRARPDFAHLHHLRDLEPGSTIHYRIVSVGVAGRRIVGEDQTLTTGSGEDLVPLQVAPGTSLVIRDPGAYRLTTDVTVAEGDAVVIGAEGVTLDLDGHTITYGTAPAPARPGRGIVVDARVKQRGPRILNGIVREGPHDAARSNGIHVGSCNGYEVGWMRVEVQSFLTSALFGPWGGADAKIHHNLLWDRGHAYANRHQGCRTISFSRGGADMRIHHNVLVGARNRAIDGGRENVEVFENTIEVLGHSTNCSGISVQGPGNRIHHNRIVARGEHPCGIWGWRDNQIFANQVHVEADMCISYEYGPLGGDGFRTNYDVNRYDGMTFHDNLIVVRAPSIPARGYRSAVSWLFWLANIGAENRVRIHDNTLVSMVSGDCETVGVGLSSNSPNLVFDGNRIISNFRCVSFGTHRGSAEKVRWVGNTFVRAGADPRFCTFGSARLDFHGNVLTDSRFEGGAKVEFQSKSHDQGDLTFRWYVDLKTVRGAAVSVRDANGDEVYSGTADGEGELRMDLVGQVLRYAGDGRTTLETFTPHRVTVVAAGAEATQEVTVDRSQVLKLRP